MNSFFSWCANTRKKETMTLKVMVVIQDKLKKHSHYFPSGTKYDGISGLLFGKYKKMQSSYALHTFI